MIVRLATAIVRAALVVLLIATPSLLIPTNAGQGAEIVALVALFGAALTIFEYAPTYPCLIEFRDAPPFNRIRFVSIFAIVLGISLMVRGVDDPAPLTEIVTSVGVLIGHATDLPYSPVRLMTDLVASTGDPVQIALVQGAAGLSFLIALLTLAVFVISLRVAGWPVRNGSFNVWVNLPTFDPSAGGDVVERLERDSRFNLAAGFILPFLIPAVLYAASDMTGALSLDNPQSLVWIIAAWAFLPASLFMRGIAMGRIAAMIEGKRRENGGKENALIPA